MAHPWQMIIYTPPYSSRQEHSDVTEADCLCHALKSADAADGTYNAAGSTVIQRQCIEAAKIGDLKQLQVLLENNIMNGLEPVDVNACIDDDGNTLLTWAAGNGHLNMCRYLVEHLGMDPRAAGGKRRRWRQPVHWSARNGHTSLCQWLVEEKGVDIDASTENGTTPLHFAIWMGHFECVAWLVEVGHCDVNRRNQFGCNAAHWAAFRGDVKMLKYMFLHGLDFLHINKNLRSPLHKAAVKGNEEACMWLLKPLAEGGPGLGIAHMQPEIEGDTPITLARSIGHLQLEHNLRKKYEELSSALAICEYN